MYLPKYTINGNELIFDQSAFDIVYCKNVLWSSFPHEKYLYCIQNSRWKISTSGYDVVKIFPEIIRLLKQSGNHIGDDIDNATIYNTLIVFMDNNWVFYYPEEYESLIISARTNKKYLYTINEYWVKTIIE